MCRHRVNNKNNSIPNDASAFICDISIFLFELCFSFFLLFLSARSCLSRQTHMKDLEIVLRRTLFLMQLGLKAAASRLQDCRINHQGTEALGSFCLFVLLIIISNLSLFFLFFLHFSSVSHFLTHTHRETLLYRCRCHQSMELPAYINNMNHLLKILSANSNTHKLNEINTLGISVNKICTYYKINI